MLTVNGTAPGPGRMLANDTGRVRILLRKTPMQLTIVDDEACGKGLSISHLHLFYLNRNYSAMLNKQQKRKRTDCVYC